MRLRTTLWLLVLTLALWAVVRGLQKRDRARERQMRDAQRFLNMTVEEVEHLAIDADPVTVACRRRNGRWFIEAPLSAAADVSTIDRVLSALESLSGTESVSVAQRRARRLTPKDYGLESPRARITVGDRVRRRVLLVGDDAPLGDLVYVKLASAGEVVAVPRTLLDVLPSSVESLRERAVLHGDPADITRVEIQRPERGFVQLALEDGRWRMLQPVACRADLPRIERLLETLFKLRVEAFVWDPPARTEGGDAPVAVSDLSQAARLEPYGLAGDEAVRVTLWSGGETAEQELLFGKTTGDDAALSFAKSRDSDSIYTVPADALAAVSVPVDDLRGRAVFGLDPERVGYVAVSYADRSLVLVKRPDVGWTVVEPMRVDADEQACHDFVKAITEWKVRDFVDGATTNLAVCGLASPTWSVRLGQDSPAGTALPDGAAAAPVTDIPTAPPRTLTIGDRLEGRDAFYAKLPGDGNQVVTLPATKVAHSRLDPARVLDFRDRTMLSLVPERIRRVTLQLGDDEQTVVRRGGEDAGWESNAPEVAPIPARVDDILFAVSNLRALRIVAMASENLERFGLQAPTGILTLGLTGDVGIQKSIILGKGIGDGVYAMVKGQDLIFVLPVGTARILTNDLVQAPPAPAEGIQP